MLSAQTATLAATTLVAVALAFYLLSTSSPEDPGTAAPPESVPVVDQAPIAAAPAEAVRTKSASHAPRSAAAPTEPSSRNGQAAAGKPAVPKKKKSDGEEHGGKKRSKAAAAEAKAAADAKAAEAEESKGEPFVNSVISRAILKQPVDLIALANPPAKESRAKGESRAKLDGKGERRKSKAKPISSWGESFQVAMQTLEGSAVDAALRAQQQLTGCLVQASKPGAPTDALVITLRCGSMGLNLQAANHVVFVTPCMDPAQRKQAIGRCHRRGQESDKVIVHNLAMQGTLEQTALALLDKEQPTRQIGGDHVQDQHQLRLAALADAEFGGGGAPLDAGRAEPLEVD